MILKNRINAFVNLGHKIDQLIESEDDQLYRSIQSKNNWFTRESTILALAGIRKMLSEEKLHEWTNLYSISNKSCKRVGVIMAGNIPMVGFHDLLTVLISGHNIMIKLSSQDAVLMKYIIEQLLEIEPGFKDKVQLADRLNDADAFIGTGSDNSARYFKYYFGQKPNIIRQNRTSVAVLKGTETKEQLQSLGKDIFTYYGLGCRNVSKVYVPKGYEFTFLLDSLQKFESFGDHHKYRNNYDYNKSIYLVNGEPHLDTGFLLLRESEDLVSPISVLYYQEYEAEEELTSMLEENKDKIQCVVGEGHLTFGAAQEPEVWDYADGVDTMQFLIELS